MAVTIHNHEDTALEQIDRKLREVCARRALEKQRMVNYESGIVQCMVALSTLDVDVERLLDERIHAAALLAPAS